MAGNVDRRAASPVSGLFPRWRGTGGRGQAVSRRAAERRAPGRSRARARRQLHHRSEPATPGPQHFSPLHRQRPRPASRLPHAGRRRAERPADHRRGGMAARQLPPGDVGDPRHPAASARLVLPPAARAVVARTSGPHADLCDGRGAGAPQRQPDRSPAACRLRQQLPAGRAADDRRAVGVAQHAEAGADRKSAAPRRRDDGGAPGTPRRRCLRGANRG